MRRVSLGILVVCLGLLLSASIAGAQQTSASKDGPSLDVSVTPSKKDVSPGGKFTWTVTTKNTGETAAKNVRVESKLPESVRLNNIISSQGNPCKVDFPKVVCKPGTIAAGKEETETFYIQAPDSRGVLKDKVKATSPNTTRNADDTAVSVVKVK